MFACSHARTWYPRSGSARARPPPAAGAVPDQASISTWRARRWICPARWHLSIAIIALLGLWLQEDELASDLVTVMGTAIAKR